VQKTSEPRHHAVEMYASARKTTIHVVTY